MLQGNTAHPSPPLKVKVGMSKVQVFDTPQVVNSLKVESDAALLLDLTGNLIVIEKLVLGKIWTEDLPICNPDTLTSALSRQANEELLGSWNVS